MPVTPPASTGSGRSPYLDEPLTVVCAATYLADGISAGAFVFRVPSTRTRFTLYAADADSYRINATYVLTLTPAATEPAEPATPPHAGDCSDEPEGTGRDHH